MILAYCGVEWCSGILLVCYSLHWCAVCVYVLFADFWCCCGLLGFGLFRCWLVAFAGFGLIAVLLCWIWCGWRTYGLRGLWLLMFPCALWFWLFCDLCCGLLVVRCSFGFVNSVAGILVGLLGLLCCLRWFVVLFSGLVPLVLVLGFIA